MKDRDAAIIETVKGVLDRIAKKSSNTDGRTFFPCWTCRVVCCDCWDGMCPACWSRLKELAEKGAEEK